LAPGESTVVELIFKTRTYRTKISKYATIYSNDPTQSTVKIHLSANVYAANDTTVPFTLSSGKVELSSESKKGKIVLENKGESKIKIEPTESLVEGLKLKIDNDDPKPGQTSELQFEWKDDFQKENIERSITFTAVGEGSNNMRFSIPVFVQGTDPTKPAQTAKTKRKPVTKSSVTGSKTVRKPIPRRVTTKSEDPKTVNQSSIRKSQPDVSSPDETKSQILEKKQELKSDDSAPKEEKESEQNQ
jgi:hypothetical protein